MNEFDKLFNEYFGNQKNRLNSIIDLMGKLNSGGGFGGMNPEEAQLGEPTTTREFERDGVIFEESTWETPMGTIVRITSKEDIEFSSDFFKKNNIPFGSRAEVKLSLEEQLDIAEADEDYEKCAKLRDAIVAREEEKVAGENKNNKGIPKKDKKDLASENLDNKGFPEEDDWNF